MGGFCVMNSYITHPPGSRIRPQDTHRCGQPGQQHGRRIPSLSSEHTLSTCCRLVSSFLTEMVQQIHSLRASGVMSSHATRALESDASAFRRSAGRLCTTPPEIRTVAIGVFRMMSAFAHDFFGSLSFRCPQILYEVHGSSPCIDQYSSQIELRTKIRTNRMISLCCRGADF